MKHKLTIDEQFALRLRDIGGHSPMEVAAAWHGMREQPARVHFVVRRGECVVAMLWGSDQPWKPTLEWMLRVMDRHVPKKS